MRSAEQLWTMLFLVGSGWDLRDRMMYLHDISMRYGKLDVDESWRKLVAVITESAIEELMPLRDAVARILGSETSPKR